MRVTCIYQGRESVHEFNRQEIIIGRANPTAPPDLDLMPDGTVSRTQARLSIEDGHYWIEDLNTKFGTFVNGVLIDSPRRLNPGDVIQVGETVLHVEVPSAPAGSVLRIPDSTPEETIAATLEAENHSLREVALSETNSREQLALLLELPLLFGVPNRVEDLLLVVLQRTLQMIPGAERGVVLLQDGESLKPVARVPGDEAAFSATLARRTLREGRGFIWRKLIDGVPSRTVRELKIKTGIYVPLLWQGKIWGVLCVDNPRRDGVFTENDLRLLLAVGQYAAQALAHRTAETG